MLSAPWSMLVVVVLSTVGIYLTLIVLSRIAGLRSFSQMTNFDFAATVAFGSITATTATSSQVSLTQGMVALAVLFATQSLLAYLRKRGRFESWADNRPLLLMEGSHELQENLARAQMTRNDLYAKLRLAGVTQLDQVQAVVLETTGEVSVLTVDPDGREVEPRLLASVDGPQPPRNASRPNLRATRAKPVQQAPAPSRPSGPRVLPGAARRARVDALAVPRGRASSPARDAAGALELLWRRRCGPQVSPSARTEARGRLIAAMSLPLSAECLLGCLTREAPARRVAPAGVFSGPRADVLGGCGARRPELGAGAVEDEPVDDQQDE